MADATATSEEQINAEVKVEETGPSARRLTITVPAEVVDEKLNEAMGTLAMETQIPGFRKGRAPKALLERRFGSALRTETRNQLVGQAYQEAVEREKLHPLGEPEPEGSLEDVEVEAGKPLTFTVTVEVVPEFDLPDYKGLEVKKPVLEITEELVERELVRYRMQLGEPHHVEGGFQEGDRLSGSARAYRKGEEEPFFTHDQVVIVHPGDSEGARGQVLGLLVDDLASKLEGHKVTDTVTIETVGPEAHEREDIRGKDLMIEFEIHQAQRIEKATDDGVVEVLGMGSRDILMEQIRMSLEQRRDEEQAGAMRQQVAERLADMVDFPLPEKLSERQIARSLERQRLELLYRGMDAEEVESRLAEIRTESEAQTRRRLKLFFLLSRLAEEFGVEVTKPEINGRVAAMAARRGVRPEQLMNELVQSGRLAEVTSQLRETKALDRVLQHADVKEISAEEWRKLQEQDSGGGGAKKPAASGSTKKKTTKKKTSKKKTSKKKASS